eukprot:gene10455-23425_t
MALHDKFHTAVKVVQSLPKEAANPEVKAALPSNEEMLECYALFKQVEKGPCTTSEKPSFWQVVDTYKYNARMELKNMSKEEAMEKYIAIIIRIISRMPPSADKDRQLNLINPPPPQKPEPAPAPASAPTPTEPKSYATAAAAPDTAAAAAATPPPPPPTSTSAAAAASSAPAAASAAPLQMLVDAADAAQRAPVSGAAAAAAAAAVLTTPTKPRETHGLMYSKPPPPQQQQQPQSADVANISALPASTSTPMKPRGGAGAGAGAVRDAGGQQQQQQQLDASGVVADSTGFQLALDKLQRDLNVTTNRVREVEFLLRDQRAGVRGGRAGGGGGKGAGVLDSFFGPNADAVRTGLWLAWPIAVAWWMKPKQSGLRRKY